MLITVEVRLRETMEHWLACHQHAFEFFGGVPRKIIIDNLKSAVLIHEYGQNPKFNPRYLEMATHYGFEVQACNVRKPHEKGRVENGVGYVKKNLLNGSYWTNLSSTQAAAKIWLDTVANVRIHGETKKQPIELFKEEKKNLISLPVNSYDVGLIKPITSNNQFRIQFEGNRYSVPSAYASRRLTLRVYPEKLLIYQQERLIAEHIRCYESNRDFENPDHVRPLLLQKRKAWEQRILQRFLALTSKAEQYYQQLEVKRFNPRHHIQKILALGERYGEAKVIRAIEDAITFEAYGCEYITNLLEQRERKLPEPSAMHLTRRQDLLDIELPNVDLSIYEKTK